MDDFLRWLSGRRVPERNVGGYRLGAAKVLAVAGGSRVLPKHVDEAVSFVNPSYR
ncbi:MAG: hypothetical protein HYZ28_19480 [Myxococcales bacterium]|nr:hypothetical protein [Myxococcales bacterium]